MLPDCSVCSKGYGKMLANSCSKCSDGREAFIAVALATAVLAVLASVWHMVSIEQEGATQGVVARFKKILPLQSIKITTVVWQIVTQVSTGDILCIHLEFEFFALRKEFNVYLVVNTAIKTTSHSCTSCPDESQQPLMYILPSPVLPPVLL